MKEETIAFEIGLREKIIDPVNAVSAATLIIDPYNNQPFIGKYNAHGLTLMEAYAEKVRAALTRNEPAIRDIYDLFYAETFKVLNLNDRHFIDLNLTQYFPTTRHL